MKKWLIFPRKFCTSTRKTQDFKITYLVRVFPIPESFWIRPWRPTERRGGYKVDREGPRNFSLRNFFFGLRKSKFLTKVHVLESRRAENFKCKFSTKNIIAGTS